MAIVGCWARGPNVGMRTFCARRRSPKARFAIGNERWLDDEAQSARTAGHVGKYSDGRGWYGPDELATDMNINLTGYRMSGWLRAHVRCRGH